MSRKSLVTRVLVFLVVASAIMGTMYIWQQRRSTGIHEVDTLEELQQLPPGVERLAIRGLQLNDTVEVRNAASVKRLYLFDCDVDSDAEQVIVKFSSLEAFSAKRCRFSALSWCNALCRLNGVQSVNLVDCTGIVADVTGVLESCRQISFVSISGCNIPDFALDRHQIGQQTPSIK